MSFVLPERYDQDNAPIPNDPKLTLSLVEPKIVGVLRYTGSTNEKKMVPLAKELHDWLLEMGYSPTSPFRSARYDPPFSLPFLRRNEIHFDVKKSDKAE